MKRKPMQIVDVRPGESEDQAVERTKREQSERKGPPVDQGKTWTREITEGEKPKPGRVERMDSAPKTYFSGVVSVELDSIKAEGRGSSVAEAVVDAVASAKVEGLRVNTQHEPSSAKEIAARATPNYVPPQAAREALADFDPVAIPDPPPDIYETGADREPAFFERKLPTEPPQVRDVIPADEVADYVSDQIQREAATHPITMPAAMANAIEDAPKTVATTPVEEWTGPGGEAAMAEGLKNVVDGSSIFGVREIPADRLLPSKSNPRKQVGDVKALAESIRTVGIQHPLLVRPSPVDAGWYEIVTGHRRFAAAQLLGLKTVPCRVRLLTDLQALEEQLIENGQRVDITPLEEAEAFERLHKQFGYSAQQIAERVHKSKETVYARLKLCDLGPEGRRALADGKLSASVALLIARIPSQKLQAEAVGKCTGDEEHDPLSEREVRKLVRETYHTELRGAPFSTKDAYLVPEVGACTGCPKRSANNPELFSDLKRADVCTDVVCFRNKVDAHWEAIAEKAKSEGKKVLSLNEGRSIFRLGPPSWDSPWVELDQPVQEDRQKRTWRELLTAKLEKTALPVVHVAADRGGQAHELWRKEDALAAAQKAGLKWAEKVADEVEKTRPATPEEKAQEEVEQTVRDVVATTVIAKAVEHIADDGFEPHHVRMCVLAMLEMSPALAGEVAMRRTLENADKLIAWAEKKATGTELCGLLFELTTTEWIRSGYTEYSDGLKATAKVFKVNLAEVEKAARTTAKADALFDQPKKKLKA